MAGYAALLFHLHNIQISNGQYYVAQAESQFAAQNSLKAIRGLIYFTDKNGNRTPAAANKDFIEIYAVPKAIPDPAEAANAIAPVLQESTQVLYKKFSKPDDEYELLEKKASAATVKDIKDIGLEGIYSMRTTERYYPFGSLAAHLLGYVGPNSEDNDLSGRYGLENFYETRLAGEPGEMRANRLVPPQAGRDLQITLDSNIQMEAARILEQLIKKYSAKGGTVIVQEPRTGKILAMESRPHYDPNLYSESPIGDFLNPTVQKVYEPGSVFKVLTMAAGIDTGKISPDTTFYDSGSLVLNGKTIRNWDLQAYGTVTMTNVIEKSLNTGAAFAQRQTGDKVFADYVDRFGFGEKTGVDLPGELAGDLRTIGPGAQPVEFATASFGQGVAVTPLQLINAIAVIANGGELMRPYVNAELAPERIRRVISPGTAAQVTAMMVSAVDKAEIAKVSGYTLAGKTGTAQVPDLKYGGYKDAYINTYVGFGPTTDPRFIILIKLDEPAGAPLAGQTVVPAFRELAQFMLNYYNIPPDRIGE